MGEPSLFDQMISHLRATSKYYTGYPKDLGPSRVIHFTSEREFVQLLHEGHPVVVAFTLRCNLTKHLDGVLEEAAAEFYPHVKFMRVECPKYPGFCITRQRKEYPFIEIFHSPQQHSKSLGGMQYDQDSIMHLIFHCSVLKAIKQIRGESGDCPSMTCFVDMLKGRVADANITKYSVKVVPFNYDTSAYGFREFFKRHGIRSSSPQ
ncbi:hypothetical protein C1H46_003085 [Malus baccata]|uniref:Thioredoxin domain-containing protein n=1 Tax=Malus baccata TaxID=106549 RepID=A0A540NK11_MALBA|nr:hypothetical protein C1H46_003085 [Malus baccata]